MTPNGVVRGACENTGISERPAFILRKKMDFAKISQFQLAVKAKISTSTVQKLVSTAKNNHYDPAASTIVAVAKALDMTAEEMREWVFAFEKMRE